MADPILDLDLLAAELNSKIEVEDLSLREASTEIGCSAATLSRLLKGSAAPNRPDTANLIRAVSWLGKPLGDFATSGRPSTSSMVDVEVHLRALPDLDEPSKEALVNTLRALHDTLRFRPKTS